MLTTRENQIIRDLQIVGSPSENARAQTLEFNKGEADGIGENDSLGYACMRPGPPVKCVFPERRVRRDWGARLGVQLQPCMVLIIQG